MVKLLLFPFWVVQRVIGIIVTCFKLVAALGTGVCRFTFSRVLGTIMGALVGALLGRKHIGIRIFPKKR